MKILYVIALASLLSWGCVGPVSLYPVPAELQEENDVLEYQSLLHSCKIIRQNIRAIGDPRMSLEDAIETSITLYLQGVPGKVAKILLEDIRKNGFQL